MGIGDFGGMNREVKDVLDLVIFLEVNEIFKNVCLVVIYWMMIYFG